MKGVSKRQIATDIRAMVARNKRKGNCKKKLYDIWGRECAEGSLLKMKLPGRRKAALEHAIIEKAGKKGLGIGPTGDVTHITINDVHGGRAGKKGHQIFLDIADLVEGKSRRKRKREERERVRREQEPCECAECLDEEMLERIAYAEEHLDDIGTLERVKVPRFGSWPVQQYPCEPDVIDPPKMPHVAEGSDIRWDGVPGGTKPEGIEVRDHFGDWYGPQTLKGWAGLAGAAGISALVIMQVWSILVNGLVVALTTAATAVMSGINTAGPWVAAACCLTLLGVSINREHVQGWWQRHQDKLDELDAREQQWREQARLSTYGPRPDEVSRSGKSNIFPLAEPAGTPGADDLDRQADQADHDPEDRARQQDQQETHAPQTTEPVETPAVDEVDETPVVEATDKPSGAEIVAVERDWFVVPADAPQPSRERVPSSEIAPLVEDEDDVIEGELVEAPDPVAAIDPPRPTNVPSWVEQGGYRVYTPEKSAYR